MNNEFVTITKLNQIQILCNTNAAIFCCFNCNIHIINKLNYDIWRRTDFFILF